jgi:hypothetical protein
VGGPERERIWACGRRVLHTCHHRTPVQTQVRLDIFGMTEDSAQVWCALLRTYVFMSGWAGCSP